MVTPRARLGSRQSGPLMRLGRREPERPEGVFVVTPEGREIPCPVLLYVGRKDGVDCWDALPAEPLVIHDPRAGWSVKCAKVPGKTAVTIVCSVVDP